MKKNGKTLLLMLAVLAVLGGAAAALTLLPTENTEESVSSAVSQAEPVLDREEAQVVSVSIENSEDSFVLVPDRSVGEVSGSESGAQTPFFTLEGWEGREEIDNSAAGSCVNALLSLEAVKALGPQEDLEKFGLSGSGAARVALVYRDGGEDALIFGKAAGESAGRYLLKDGSVYIVSVPDELFENRFAFFLKQVYSVPGRTQETQEENRLYSLKVSGAAFPEPVELSYNESADRYEIISPIWGAADDGQMTGLIYTLKTLTAESVADEKASPEELEGYGLAEPDVQAEFSLNDETHVLKASARREDGSRYLTVDDGTMVFLVGGETVSDWAEIDLMELRESQVLAARADDVKKLSLTVDGDMLYAYTVEREKDEERSTEANPLYALTIENAGGKEILSPNYQSFFEYLAAVSVLSTEKPSYGGTPWLKAELEYFEGGGDAVEFFLVDGQERCAAVVNGTFSGLVPKSGVEYVISLLPDLDGGKIVD